MAENLTQSVDASSMLLVLLDLISRDKNFTLCAFIAERNLCSDIPCSQCPLLNRNRSIFLQEITPLAETIKLLNPKE